MGRRTSTTGYRLSRTTRASMLVTVFCALTLVMPARSLHAESILIRFQDGVLCDKADQVESIVAQHGKMPLRDVLVALNDKTGKISCGMVRQPVMLYMEPLRVVNTDGKKFMIIKLTTLRGAVQYAWRPMGSDEQEDGQSV